MPAHKKLTDEDKKLIIQDHQKGEMTRKEIALKFNITPPMVAYVVCPEKEAINKQKAKERPTEKEMNRLRVQRCRERQKEVKN